MSENLGLGVFRQAAKEVPAYADFLRQHGVEVGTVKTLADFLHLPLTSKQNYLQQYKLEDLLLGNGLRQPLIFCATSGSTGTPYYFPRTDALSEQYARLLQDYLLQSDAAAQKKTLVLVGFGMGVWIGGVITLRAFEIASARLKYPLSVLPVGYNKAELFKALEQLAPQYDQTIIVGYPPFIKQIVDEALLSGIDLKALHIRLLFAAESFTESFRDYLCERVGANPLLDTLNVYGTADIGAMAYETPLSILVRRLAMKDKLLFQKIFGQIEKTPTLAQYNPRFMHFESVQGEIVISGKTVLPLIRYAVGDHGGVYSYAALKRVLAKQGYDIDKEAKQAGIDHTVRKFPFVYVYERKNFSVTLHGMNIYPEFIKDGLMVGEIASLATGRFTTLTCYDEGYNQYLEVNVELYKGAVSNAALKRIITKSIRTSLMTHSSEFVEFSKMPESKHLLRVVFWPQDHPTYFAPGTKQRWVQTEK